MWPVSRKSKIADWTGGIVKAEGLDDGSAPVVEDHRQAAHGAPKRDTSRLGPLDAATRAIRDPPDDVSSAKGLLEKLYAKYNHRVFVPPDPLQFVYRYTEHRDMEIAAFLASALAYGRVRQIERSLIQLFDRMDSAPFHFTSHFAEAGRAKLRSFKHRFTTGGDVSDLLALFRRVLDDYGSLESFFALGYHCEDATILPALSRFCDSLCQMHGGLASAGLNYLLANPSRGSASKRLNLFLRWLVRRDEVDLGLWERIDRAKLVVPMDVHMGRLCRILGLHDDKTVSLSTALKVSRAFARMNPEDPVKYDFALSRLGILEECTGRPCPACGACELRRLCAKRAGSLESA
jgi:uncharacterized protein (TIGR02757 family)